MSSEAKQKICIECRAIVPQDAAECPECGYPFSDTGVLRCNACSSIIVDDLQHCPVCGETVEVVQNVPPPQADVLQSETESVELPTDLQPEPFSSQPEAEPQLYAGDDGAIMGRLDTISYALHQLASAIQSNTKVNDEILRLLKESSQDVRKSIDVNQVANQRVLQETMDLIKVVYESVGGGKNSDHAEQLTDVKAAIAEISAQQTASANMVIAAVKENAAVKAASPALELPASVKWLDYMFIAIVVTLIFSMGSLLVMAYIARLIMSQE